jgi:hypothetical protein
MEGNEDITEKTRETRSNSGADNEISLQENDSELFVIDVTGRKSKDDTKCISDEDDECDYNRTVRRKLFQVDAVGQDGDNEDLDTDYESDDNCVTGNIIFIKCTYVYSVISLSSIVQSFRPCYSDTARVHKAVNVFSRKSGTEDHILFLPLI